MNGLILCVEFILSTTSTIKIQEWLVVLQCFEAFLPSLCVASEGIFSIWVTNSEGRSRYIDPLRVVVNHLGNFYGFLLPCGLPLGSCPATYTCNYLYTDAWMQSNLTIIQAQRPVYALSQHMHKQKQFFNYCACGNSQIPTHVIRVIHYILLIMYHTNWLGYPGWISTLLNIYGNMCLDTKHTKDPSRMATLCTDLPK